MKLIERESDLSLLMQTFAKVSNGEGHSIFLHGESGIGKTSLLKAFTNELKHDFNIYQGVCDALFTPRPLAPLYDIAWQVRHDLINNDNNTHDRSDLFLKLFRELKSRDEVSVIVFEDIHWADEATIDFIKFMSRRITQLRCMFILSYRDNEIHSGHPLSNLFGQLPPDTFTRMELNPLSFEAVRTLAEEKGYDGEKVYEVSGGNPFYVSEILSDYSEGVPMRIRDAIISAYNRTGENTKQVWDLLSVIPGKFELKYLEKFAPSYMDAIDNCLHFQILIQDEGQIFFKHELFRRAIENGLSPLKRVALNKKVLELFLENFESNEQIERIVHHAKNANEYDLVVKYAPIAARRAAGLGAHIEASKLLRTAIEYYQGNDPVLKRSLYNAYAYECYLTNNIKEAIVYAGKALKLWKAGNETANIADCMRFLSHLKCCDGDTASAIKLAQEAIDILGDELPSKTQVLAFSNISQLKMLHDDVQESMDWAKRSYTLAELLDDEEALCLSLVNMGAIQMIIPSSRVEGTDQLLRGLSIALRNAYHEHAARAYATLACNALKLKDNELLDSIIEEGIRFSDERDLYFWMYTMLSIKAKLQFEKGNWSEAIAIADKLTDNDYKGSFRIDAIVINARICMRQGDLKRAFDLLVSARSLAFERLELQTMLPFLTGSLEYEWLTGESVINTGELSTALKLIEKSVYHIDNNECAFWLMKAKRQHLQLKVTYPAYNIKNVADAHRAASHWHELGNPYNAALALFEGDEEDKKSAILKLQELGADNVCEKIKQEMRSSGIKGIPRGLRNSTRLNPALLTGREMDVLQLLKDGLQNKEIAGKLFISAKTVDHHISSILFKLDVNSRVKAVHEALKLDLLK